MAIYKNAKFTVGGTDISTHIRRLAFNRSAETVDDTAMGDDTRTNAGSLEVWGFEGECNQAYSSGSPDAVFATNVGESVSIVFRHTSTSTGLATSNPKYSGSGVVSAYTPADGSVGDQHVSTFSIVAGGTLPRSVAS